ncbi:MAG: neutral/alkaline non-lysosomal ceramidase N-terminal domain-containing protein [Candidatus Marinimicrobia bacterium]|nr:neutral/alkaline non-lysosomal ceramidase N-terminal domain-containing protein [Candidatus Neomarinimicrobiota bacterium]
MKFLRRLIMALGLGIIFCLIATIAPVDKTPLSESRYYQLAQQKLDSLNSSYTLQDSKYFKAGWAKTNITPQYPLPLAGYGARKGVFVSTVHDSVWARGFVFDNGFNKSAIITLDLLIIPPAVTEALRILLPEIGYSQDQIFLSATHTHCSVGGWADSWIGTQFAGEYQNEIVNDLAIAIITTIKKAETNLVSAKVGYARYDASPFTRNRLVGEKGSRDTWLRVVKIQQESGAVALITTFAAHATVLSHRQMNYSRDYPGALVDSLENITNVDFAAFCAGAVGSHSPVTKGGKSYNKIALLASNLKSLIGANVSSIPINKVQQSGTIRFDVPLRKPHIRVAANWRVRPWIFEKLTEVSPAYISLLRIGNIAFIGTPCDFSGELTAAIDEKANALDLNVLVTSFNGGYIGYITKDEWYNLKEYETFVMNWFGPYNGAYFVNLIQRLLEVIS